MPNQHGEWIWYELLTSDVAAAQNFYEKVIGWNIAAFPGARDETAAASYRIATAPDGAGVAGLMTMPDGAPMRPGWFGYIGVDDVDAAVAAVERAGGVTHMPATDLEGVGRFAMLADPQGVVFYVMRGASDEASTAYHRHARGHCSWAELLTTDDAPALQFYGTLFGMTKAGAMTMPGDMGDYSFLRHGHDAEPFGAAMRKTPDQPGAMWRFYFRVPDIAAAAQAVRDNGGRVTAGPMEVPGGEHIILIEDPQGAALGLVAAATAA